MKPRLLNSLTGVDTNCTNSHELRKQGAVYVEETLQLVLFCMESSQLRKRVIPAIRDNSCISCHPLANTDWVYPSRQVNSTTLTERAGKRHFGISAAGSGCSMGSNTLGLSGLISWRGFSGLISSTR